MKKILIASVCIFAMFSCDAVFETKLTDKTVTVVTPSDGLELEPGEVTFVWRETDGARSYHLRIVGGSFEGGSHAVADTVMHNDSTGVKLSHKTMLEEGVYQWSIVARNDAYKTTEKILTLFITAKQPEDISGVEVSVIAPADGVVLESGEATFLWRELKGATAYHITIVGPSFDNAASVVADETLSDGNGTPPRSYKCSIGPGHYQWSIKAINEKYESVERILSFEVIGIQQV